jgi:hypothetical protein
MFSVAHEDLTESTVPTFDDEITTGHAEIDAALRRVGELDDLPVHQHGEILDQLHGHLRDALAAAASPSGGADD